MSGPDEATAAAPVRRPRALVADDARVTRRLVRRVLEGSFGAEVVEAETGTRACELARAESFDLAVLDLNMPGASGMDVLAALRESERGRGTLVLVATADDLAEPRLEPLGRDALSAALAKPFAVDTLEAVLRGLLAARGARA